MPVGRLVSGVLASLGVAGCAVLVLGLTQPSGQSHSPAGHRAADRQAAPRPAWLPMHAGPGAAATSSSSTSAPASPTPSRTPTSSAAAAPSSPAARASSTAASRARPAAAPVRAAPAAAASGQALPLRFSTGTATRVITVVASSTHSTTATLQAWNKAAGGGWRRYGGSVTAHVGADGLSTHPCECSSATPIGSFTLTQAFGALANPGTGLPYFRTTPADWWISQAGPLYNTHQRCSAGCAFRQGDPNEHLYYETPFYNYAVVIDYNTRNAPGGVRQGAGSAFFLHVHPSGSGATAGCVSIPQSTLVTLMQWLQPSAHPRILIGVG